MKYWVAMTDTFMSGWVHDMRISKLVVECDDYKQALSIHGRAQRRPEMKYINIHVRQPSYDALRFVVSTKRFDEILWEHV
jgi:hypothetical protein